MECFSDEEFGELQEFGERAVGAAARRELRKVFSAQELAEFAEESSRIVVEVVAVDHQIGVLEAELAGALFTVRELEEFELVTGRVVAECAATADVLGDIGDLLG
jgi:hypothetical protein